MLSIYMLKQVNFLISAIVTVIIKLRKLELINILKDTLYESFISLLQAVLFSKTSWETNADLACLFLTNYVCI
jgi:hypothetical protein